MTPVRRAWRAAGLVAAAGSLLASCRDSGSGSLEATAGDLLRGDRRVLELLVPCPRAGFFDRDLSDMAPILTEKLELGRPDPLKRAKEELGLLGAAAHPTLGRFFQRHYGDMMRTPLLENAIDALAFNRSDASHDLLLEATLHPQESVRRKAYGALGQHQRAADFEVLVERLDIEQGDTKNQLVAVLHRCAPERAESLYLDWLEASLQGRSGEGPNAALTSVTAPLLAASRDARIAQRCAGLFARMDGAAAALIAAAGARAGDDEALAYLRSELRHENPQHRLGAVNAVRLSELLDLLEYTLFEEADSSARAIAVNALGRQAELGQTHRSWLRSACNDPSPVVQGAALEALCAHSDPEGLARALAQLREEDGRLASALQALRQPMRADEALAHAALDVLLERNALEQSRPLLKRTATLKAIGQLPLPEAAEFLHRLGREAAGESLEGLRAHDWLMIQAGNTGVPGRARLHELLLEETDPLLRLDLIDAVACDRDELTRTALMPLAENPEGEPLERLFVASVLIRCGPSWEIAPGLKRAVFAMQAPGELEARRALQCLLWAWY